MKSDLLEKFVALKGMKVKVKYDEDGDVEDYELSKKQLKQLKEAAEIFAVMEDVLDCMHHAAKYELGNLVAGSPYWSSSSFSC